MRATCGPASSSSSAPAEVGVGKPRALERLGLVLEQPLERRLHPRVAELAQQARGVLAHERIGVPRQRGQRVEADGAILPDERPARAHAVAGLLAERERP
ncbi:hypothetical protein BE20_19635 [Sorangium cellulosum]|nr:hypothetical protein BE20_19635 [Sorangium cellulosum]